MLLPVQPSVWVYSRPRSGKEKLEEGRIYSAYHDGTVYVIISVDKSPLPAVKDEIFTNELQQVLAINEARTESKITRHNVRGLQYRSASDKISSIGELYPADNHIYFFAVYSEDVNRAAVKQFLSSIAVGAKAKDKVLKERGPVVVPTTSPGMADDPNRVFNTKQGIQKALIVTRPQPRYTEEARQNAVTGTVILRAVFAANGDVTNIKPVKGLPDGLTEKAVAAARNIKFIPAKKDGRFVSQYIQIEYNFNLY